MYWWSNHGIHSQNCIALQLIYWCTQHVKVQSIQNKQSKEHVHPFKYRNKRYILFKHKRKIKNKENAVNQVILYNFNLNNHSHIKRGRRKNVHTRPSKHKLSESSEEFIVCYKNKQIIFHRDQAWKLKKIKREKIKKIQPLPRSSKYHSSS
jgi:hypothetical protein